MKPEQSKELIVKPSQVFIFLPELEHSPQVLGIASLVAQSVTNLPWWEI